MDDEEENNLDNVMLVTLPDPDNINRTITVPVVVPPGRLEELARESPDLASGFRRPSMDELRALAREQDIQRRQAVIRENPIVGRLATFGINMVNDLTLGLSALAFDEDDRRTFEATQRELPGTSMVGSLTGAVAPALVTGGATLGRTGAAALLPGVGIQAAENSLERVLVRRLVNQGMSEGAATAIARSGAMSVGGALGGIQAAVTEANISGTPLDAQSILANSLIGAGLGLGIGGLSAARLGRRAQQQAERLTQHGLGTRGAEVLEDGSIRMIPQVNEEASGPLARLWSSRVGRAVTGFVGESDGEDLRKLMAPGAMREAAERRAFSVYVNELSNITEEALNSTRREVIDNLRSAEFRQRGFRELVHDASANAKAASFGASIRAEGRKIRELVSGPDASRFSDSTIKKAKQMADLIEAAGTADNAAQLATNLDNFLDRVRVNKLGEGFQDTDLRALISSSIVQAEESLSRLGPAGESAVAAQRAVQEFDNAVRDLRGNALKHNISFDEERLNPGALFSSVSDPGYRAKLDLTQDFERLNEVSGRAARLAQERFGIETAEDIHRMLVDSTERLSEARRKGELVAIYQDLSNRESRGSALFAALGAGGISMGVLAGSAIGGVPGMLVGAGVAATLAAASRPISALSRLGVFSKAKAQTQERLVQETSKLKKVLQSGRRAFKGRIARAIPESVLNLKSQDTRRQEYKEITNQLRDLANNPQSVMDTLSELMDGPSEVSPELAEHMASTYVRALQYLASEIPPADQPGPFSHLIDMEPSFAEIESFVRKFEAIEDPIGIISMAANFSLTPDHVTAVQTVYPELYGLIQAEVTNMVGELDKLPPYSARMMVGTLLDVPTDPSLDSEFIYRLQQRYAQTPQQQQEVMSRQITSGGIARIANNTYSASTSISMRLGMQ